MKECNSALTETVIDCAIEVHHTLVPGLLENTYERCLAHESSLRSIPIQTSGSYPYTL